jgi:hypothetical protein
MMLTAVYVEVDDDPEDLIIKLFEGNDESRTFWVRDRALLSDVARICLEGRLNEMENDQIKKTPVTRNRAT